MLIDPVGILRRHQREVRHPMTTMTNVSTATKPIQMNTLDKMWKTFNQQDEDVVMDDKEQETPTDMVNDKKNYKENEKKDANDNDDDDKKDEAVKTTYEFAVRIKIKANTKEQAHKYHQHLLGVMDDELENFNLYSKKNEIVHPKQVAIDNFEYNENGKRTKYFTVVHGMESTQTYHQIKQNEKIFQCLKATNCYIQKHLWKETEWNIITIGFLSGASPKHQLKEAVKQTIFKDDEKSPKYELGAATIKTNHNGIAFSTFAYEVKCKETDVEAVCDHLTKRSKKTNTTILKHKWKYTHPDVYTNGIKKQNEYIKQIRTIPVYGIIEEAMDYLYQPLLSNEHIIDISPTAKTTTCGRWNVYTTAANFESTTKWIQTNLKTLYMKHCNGSFPKSIVPDHFVPEVKFNTTVEFQNHKHDRHLENATSSVSSYHSSPANSWASVVSGYTSYSVPSKLTEQTPSAISSVNNFTKTLQDINKSIEKICERLDRIEAKLEEHEKAIKQVQEVETNTQSNMEKLTDIIQKLGERINYVSPRRLEHSFDRMESNKRQDTRSSPGKGLQRS